ncbi:tyrosine-type recombinase/integrase [Sinorhizobium fredii]|uniref:tyrosine-type recombinase/integrase n=1 Tax=Rhizobium fredii TaxID=380 RepID=UPI0004B9DD46|nr:tyrosine-type recombinase/integrase [Sinorhizobium fredii]
MKKERRQNKYEGWKIFRDRKPPFKWRAYHRITGEKIDCDKFQPFTLGFDMEVHRINELHKEKQAKPGTLGMLIKLYRASDEFLDPEIGKAKRTQRDYQRVFDYLKPIEDTRLTWFTTAKIVKLRDKAYKKLKWKWANYVVTVLFVLFKWGKLPDYVKANPAAEIPPIPRPKSLPDANRPWTDAEREAVLAALPPHMLLPISLMMFYALDPQDALALPKTAVSAAGIDTRRQKTGEPVYLPLFEPVADALARSPRHNAITLCANSRGKPWTYNGFSTNWYKIKKKLEDAGAVQPGLTLKGLRHTVATILREMGKDYGTIQNVLGHKTEAMARHYSRRADKTKETTAAVADFGVELNKRKTKVVKPTS